MKKYIVNYGNCLKDSIAVINAETKEDAIERVIEKFDVYDRIEIYSIDRCKKKDECRIY